MDRDEFAERANVSRETIEKLSVYADLLKKWTPSINLVAKSTLANLWHRHFLDSAQVLDLARLESGHWVDIGTGGGFPGLVVAVISAEKHPEYQFTFVESDARKSEFLRTVIRNLSLTAKVVTKRIEEVECLNADILSVRALASLSILAGYAEQHLKPTGRAIFMKGASFRRELDEALETWEFQSEEYASITDDAAVILKLGDIKRV